MTAPLAALAGSSAPWSGSSDRASLDAASGGGASGGGASDFSWEAQVSWNWQAMWDSMLEWAYEWRWEIAFSFVCVFVAGCFTLAPAAVLGARAAAVAAPAVAPSMVPVAMMSWWGTLMGGCTAFAQSAIGVASVVVPLGLAWYAYQNRHVLQAIGYAFLALALLRRSWRLMRRPLTFLLSHRSACGRPSGARSPPRRLHSGSSDGTQRRRERTRSASVRDTNRPMARPRSAAPEATPSAAAAATSFPLVQPGALPSEGDAPTATAAEAGSSPLQPIPQRAEDGYEAEDSEW
mmetsp:Transcript_76242/g.246740  ORF Transcript_76242/g.246740 Transcript_76242/m.246740 type:complete len:292 (+) Transcript_76242:183-1058(+)